jgi:hypothetical protein
MKTRWVVLIAVLAFTLGLAIGEVHRLKTAKPAFKFQRINERAAYKLDTVTGKTWLVTPYGEIAMDDPRFKEVLDGLGKK